MPRVSSVLRVDSLAMVLPAGFRIAVPRLDLARGEAVFLYGPSGCGKSTALLSMFGFAGRDAVVEGTVALFGRPLADLTPSAKQTLLRSHVAWLLQDAQNALDPLQPVGEQIRQATYRSLRDGVAALAELGIADAEQLARRLPHAVSGGEAQRALFAIASLRQPELLVADEPTANLDDRSAAAVAARLQALRQAGAALLVATHDHRLLDALGGTVLVASGGVFAPGAIDRRPWPAQADAQLGGATPVLRARNLRVRHGDREVLAGVDLDLRRGEVVALLGDSGAGKTTLARVLAGHRAADAGTVDRPPRRTAVQLLPQDAGASLTPGRTVRELVAEAHAPFFDIEAAAASLGLTAAHLDRTVAGLSGGERRRAALLRALAVHPDVLVLDEPTAALDRATAVAVVASLLALRAQRGLALLLITHDGELARAAAHRVLTLAQGRT